MDDLSNNMSYKYKYKLAYVCLDEVNVDIIHKYSYKPVVTRPVSNARNTDLLLLNLQHVKTNVNTAKMNFSGVANFHVDLSCARDSWKI